MNKENVKILILDDEPIVATSVECYLEDRGWDLVVCNSAEDALTKLDDKTISAVIVDIRLGGMSGEMFIRKAHEVRPDLKFMICTGSPNYMIDDTLHQIPTLFPTVFTKPVDDLATIEDTLIMMLK